MAAPVKYPTNAPVDTSQPPEAQFDIERSARSVDDQRSTPVVEIPSKTASSFHLPVDSAKESLVAYKNPCRRAIMITQLGTVDVWIGFSSSVSPSNGDLLPGTRGSIKVYGTAAEVHAIADTGTSEISVVELSE